MIVGLDPTGIAREATAGIPGGQPENGAGPEALEPATPPVRFVPLGDYVASPKGSPEALLGGEDDVLLPAAGLLMVYGDAGAGKTTLDVDAVAHLASGSDWLGIPVARPVKIALIQNEGPAEPWRRKLESKLASWAGPPWRDNVLVLDEPHGGFDFRLPEHREAVRQLRAQGVELVFADPTKWIGVEGGGTPNEVRDFVALLKECGLHSGDPDRALAFWLAHHENKAGEISGAWRADPDTVAHVESDGGRRTKVTWDKCRWSSSRHGQLSLLAWAEGDGYEVMELAGAESLSDGEVDEQVLAFLEAEAAEGRTPATSHVRKAVSVRSEKVDEALERLLERGEASDLDAKGRPHSGRPRTPRYWKLGQDAGSQVVPLPGTTSDDRQLKSRSGEEAPREVVPSSRLKGGTTSTGRLRRDHPEAMDRGRSRNGSAGPCPSCGWPLESDGSCPYCVELAGAHAGAGAGAGAEADS